VADRATRPVERLCEFASGRRSRFRANAHRAGAGRRRVRQRAEPHLHPTTTRGAQCDPSQAWKENLEYPWGARRNAAGISATALSAPRSDREPVQFGETQALGSCPGPLAAHAKASSSAARVEFQSVPPEASLTFLEDVNRARWRQCPRKNDDIVQLGAFNDFQNETIGCQKLCPCVQAPTRCFRIQNASRPNDHFRSTFYEVGNDLNSSSYRHRDFHDRNSGLRYGFGSKASILCGRNANGRDDANCLDLITYLFTVH